MNVCIDCGKKIDFRGKRCQDCYCKILCKFGTASRRIFFFSDEKIQICQAFKNEDSLRKLAQKFGCSRGPIGKILIDELGIKEYKKLAKEPHLKYFSKKEKLKIIANFKDGTSLGKLAQKFECSNSPIIRILNGELGKSEYIKIAKKHQEAAPEASHKSNYSWPEILFSLILANENVQFTHQFQIKKWTVDFLIWPNIIVQIDGVYWHCEIRGNQLKDWYQNRELQKMGYKVIRFWDFEIANNLEDCIKKIKRCI